MGDGGVGAIVKVNNAFCSKQRRSTQAASAAAHFSCLHKRIVVCFLTVNG
jgi:hypothetical protein